MRKFCPTLFRLVSIPKFLLNTLEYRAGRQHGALFFRLTQVFSGNGCFGKYLHSVARTELSPAYHHCDSSENSAQHIQRSIATDRRKLYSYSDSNFTTSWLQPSGCNLLLRFNFAEGGGGEGPGRSPPLGPDLPLANREAEARLSAPHPAPNVATDSRDGFSPPSALVATRDEATFFLISYKYSKC